MQEVDMYSLKERRKRGDKTKTFEYMKGVKKVQKDSTFSMTSVV